MVEGEIRGSKKSLGANVPPPSRRRGGQRGKDGWKLMVNSKPFLCLWSEIIIIIAAFIIVGKEPVY
jgi:hypothetical protein